MICEARSKSRLHSYPVYMPTPSEIQQQAAKIREALSPSEQRRRAKIARVQLQVVEYRLLSDRRTSNQSED